MATACWLPLHTSTSSGRASRPLLRIHASVGRLGDLGIAGRADERASADLAGQQAAPGGFGVGAAHGAHRHAQALRQVAVGRETRAGLEAAGFEVVGKGGGDGEVERTASWADVGHPHCHGDNVCLDMEVRQAIAFFLDILIVIVSIQ
jgi:hypothetical protein